MPSRQGLRDMAADPEYYRTFLKGKVPEETLQDMEANPEAYQRSTAVPAADPSIHDISLEEEIESRARKIRALTGGLRHAALADLKREMASYERNVSIGSKEYQGMVDKLQKIYDRSLTLQERMMGVY